MSVSRHPLIHLRLLLIVLSITLLATASLAAPAITEQEGARALEATQVGFRAVHAKVMPAVVSISSQAEVEDEDDPFNFFFGTQRPTQVRRATGSGVIINENGIVLTNSHVVENATKVTVQLSNSERSLPAEVLQTDPRTDLAVIRITEKGKYPVATLGDASKVQVGDWAIAFGSPFRLPSTMTIGVISATGRHLNGPSDDFTYRDLLQTDASINPGNSGGPLVNIAGEIIGINFMIYSPGQSAGSVGIGFAIPINDYTKRIITTLAEGRAVQRGRLGVIVKNLDDAMREHYAIQEGGIFVDSVTTGQAADKAGLQAEDIILALDGTRITDIDQFIRLIEETDPGTKITLTIQRNKREQKIVVTVGAAPTLAKADVDERKVGLSVATITPDIAEQLRLRNVKGVVVTRVQQGSPADDIGLRRGDIIQRVGSAEVASQEEFWTAVSKGMAASKYGILLRVRRGDMTTTVTLAPM